MLSAFSRLICCWRVGMFHTPLLYQYCATLIVICVGDVQPKLVDCFVVPKNTSIFFPPSISVHFFLNFCHAVVIMGIDYDCTFEKFRLRQCLLWFATFRVFFLAFYFIFFHSNINQVSEMMITFTLTSRLFYFLFVALCFSPENASLLWSPHVCCVSVKVL